MVERRSSEVLSTQLTDDVSANHALRVHLSRAKLIARSTVDMPWRNFVRFRLLFFYFNVSFRVSFCAFFNAEMASPGNQHCASCTGTLSFPIAVRVVVNCSAYRHVGGPI